MNAIIKNISLIFFSLGLTTIAQSKIITDYDETLIQSPLTDSNEEMLLNTVCRSRDHLRWDYCSDQYDNNEEQMKSFKFINEGENRIVQKSGIGIGREFEFLFQGFARSDLGLLVWDTPDETISHGHLKLMMFFPRLIIPAIRYISDSKKDLVIVTLPNKEEVIFNGKSKEVVGGVLLEEPIKQDNEGNAFNPDLKYTGSGVVVEADRLNDYPVGLAAQSKMNYATVRKKGFKDCKILVKDLWYTDENKGGNIFFNKKYVTDAAFDKLIKQRCKFSIY